MLALPASLVREQSMTLSSDVIRGPIAICLLYLHLWFERLQRLRCRELATSVWRAEAAPVCCTTLAFLADEAGNVIHKIALENNFVMQSSPT
jgi:hypothetical protein